LIEWVGNFHSHTRFSDGTATHRRVAEAAAQAGLNGVAVTDHNVWVKGLQGYYRGVLLLVGEEVHDPCRHPQVNHALILGLQRELAPLAAFPQALIDAAREQGALIFLSASGGAFPRMAAALDGRASPAMGGSGGLWVHRTGSVEHHE
jgi:predicted metal-dependent phosphoesterase TrpH